MKTKRKTARCDGCDLSAHRAGLFISLNLGVIKIAPLKTLQVFFGQGTARDELVLFEFRRPGSSFPCSLVLG